MKMKFLDRISLRLLLFLYLLAFICYADNAAATDVGTQTICASDNRVQSYDDRQGRITLGGYCTAWLISKSIFVTSGHCGNATVNSKMSFTSPPPIPQIVTSSS